MKNRKSKAYLIVSSAYLGVSEEIVKVFARVAEYYNASVYHLGPTISDKEAKQYYRVMDKVLALRAKIAIVEASLENATDDGRDSDVKQISRTLASLTHSLEALELQANSVVYAERERIDTLIDHFGKITMITAPGDGTLESPDMFTRELHNISNISIIESGAVLSKYMYLSAVMPSSERVTAKPITKRAMDYLKQHGKFSWVVAHPVPAVETLEKPGLNNAHKFYTVGSMRHVVAPKGHRQFFRVAHLPCAMIILVDENGEYHAKQMHIDYIPSKKTSTASVLDDGLVFTADGVKEVESSDKGTISTDDHAPYQHPGTLGAFRALNTLHQPAWLINNGDAADFSSISPHTHEAPGKRENLRLQDDINALRDLLDAQSNAKSIKHKILIDSNHHEWVTRFVDTQPSLKGMLDWQTLAEKVFPDWNIYIREAGDNKIFNFGDYIIRHGDKESIEKGARMSESGKYLCGHHHRYYTFLRALSMGCGAGLGPDYIGNQVTSWVSQIGSLTKFKGIAAVNPKIVLHDTSNKKSRFAYRNNIFEVDFYDISKVKLKMGTKNRRNP